MGKKIWNGASISFWHGCFCSLEFHVFHCLFKASSCFSSTFKYFLEKATWSSCFGSLQGSCFNFFPKATYLDHFFSMVIKLLLGLVQEKLMLSACHICSHLESHQAWQHMAYQSKAAAHTLVLVVTSYQLRAPGSYEMKMHASIQSFHVCCPAAMVHACVQWQSTLPMASMLLAPLLALLLPRD